MPFCLILKLIKVIINSFIVSAVFIVILFFVITGIGIIVLKK